jgi:hypothetical protein
VRTRRGTHTRPPQAVAQSKQRRSATGPACRSGRRGS